MWAPPDDRGAQGDPTSESGGVGAILGRLAKIVDNLRLSFDIPDVLGAELKLAKYIINSINSIINSIIK